MENYFRPTEPLMLGGNISENWKSFSQQIDLLVKATDLDTNYGEKKK